MDTSISNLQKEISGLKKENQNQQSKITEMGRKLQTAEGKIHSGEIRLVNAERYGSWCAYQDSWRSSSALIKYQKILHAYSNMNINALNTGSGEFRSKKRNFTFFLVLAVYLVLIKNAQIQSDFNGKNYRKVYRPPYWSLPGNIQLLEQP